MATEHQEVINHGIDVINSEFKKLMIKNKELQKENDKLKEENHKATILLLKQDEVQDKLYDDKEKLKKQLETMMECNNAGMLCDDKGDCIYNLKEENEKLKKDNEKLNEMKKYDKFKCNECKAHHTGCSNPTCDTCVEQMIKKLKEEIEKLKNPVLNRDIRGGSFDIKVNMNYMYEYLRVYYEDKVEIDKIEKIEFAYKLMAEEIDGFINTFIAMPQSCSIGEYLDENILGEVIPTLIEDGLLPEKDEE
jgi:hypothetical protein